MAKDHHCPACNNAVDRAATICSNPECRAELAFCSHCCDVTNYRLVKAGSGRFSRDHYECARCNRIGVKCLTWLAGGYCNGLARAGTGLDRPLCTSCMSRATEIGRSVLGWSIMGALGGLLRRRK